MITALAARATFCLVFLLPSASAVGTGSAATPSPAAPPTGAHVVELRDGRTLSTIRAPRWVLGSAEVTAVDGHRVRLTWDQVDHAATRLANTKPASTASRVFTNDDLAPFKGRLSVVPRTDEDAADDATAGEAPVPTEQLQADGPSELQARTAQVKWLRQRERELLASIADTERQLADLAPEREPARLGSAEMDRFVTKNPTDGVRIHSKSGISPERRDLDRAIARTEARAARKRALQAKLTASLESQRAELLDVRTKLRAARHGLER